MTRVHSFAVDGPLPLHDHRPSLVWLSPTVSLVGWGAALRIDAGVGPGRFQRVDTAFREWCERVEIADDVGLAGSGPIGFTSFTFDPRSAGSTLIVPEVSFGIVDEVTFVTTVDGAEYCRFLHPAGTAESPPDRPRYAGASIPDVMWLEAVAEACQRIEAEQVEKVVLARDYAVWSKRPFDSRQVLTKLHRRFPDCYTFLVDGLVGASPELLVRRNGSTVEAIPLAGSIGRSDDPDRDELLGKELISSDKNRREHEMAAVSVSQVLEQVCERLVGNAEPYLLRLANVQHLATRFRGTLRDSPSVLDLAGLLHPTAAVGGTPTDGALATIDELEGMDRGRYAGPVGWLDRHGDGEFAVALRCAELSGARARLFAGAGIVRGSLPEAELEETRLKLEAMLTALG